MEFHSISKPILSWSLSKSQINIAVLVELLLSQNGNLKGNLKVNLKVNPLLLPYLKLK